MVTSFGFCDGHFDIEDSASVSAYYYPFRHIGDTNAILKATLYYEKSLFYYQAQLSQANSPYAFPTLGSAMTISMKHYGQVRGFPKRSGGEDFYLLNKLSKIGKVKGVANAEVQIQARVSERVPFGTGPAVKTIMEKIAGNETITYYSPTLFLALKKVLQSISIFWHDSAWPNHFDRHIHQALLDAGLPDFIDKRRQQDKTLKQFEKSFHDWFDAFQTLKFIRRLDAVHDRIELDKL